MQSQQQPAGRREWIGLMVLALPTLLVSMDMTILYLAAPSLSADLKPSGAELLWISDIYGFLLAGVLIPMGAIGDQIGRRKLLLTGSLFFGAASVLAAYSTSPSTLISARALLGVAGATLLPSTLAMIRNMFHVPRQRSVAIGLWTTCFTLGGVIGPLVGGFLLEHFWWGSVFLIGAPVMVVLLVLGPFLLPEFQSPGRPIDPISVVLSVVSMLSITYAVKHGAEQGISPIAIAFLALGLLAGLAFVHRQRRLRYPLFDLGLFRNTDFTAVLGANTMALFAWVGASLLVAQYLQLVIGMSPLTAGLWTVPPAVACIVGCLGAPALSKRLSPVSVVSGSLFLTAVGLAILAFFSSEGRLTAIILGMTVLGLGVASIVTLGTDLILTTAPPEKAGAVSAISETGAELGGALGVAVLGSIGVATYRMSVAIPAGVDPAQGATARDTLGAAADVAASLPDATAALLLASAQGAFTRGLEIAMGTGSALLLAMTFFFSWSALRRSTHAAWTSIGDSDDRPQR